MPNITMTIDGEIILKLQRHFNDRKVKIGGKNWRRESLYER